VFSAIDHVMLGVRDRRAALDAFKRIGFEVRGEGNDAAIFNHGDCLRFTQAAGAEGLRSIALHGDADRLELEHVTLARQRNAAAPSQHPNGVVRLERVYIAVADVAASAARYAAALGMGVPKVERGTVIQADMAVFNIGAPGAQSGLTLAQPAGPGPAAEALARQGPGPFQVLYRTSSMDAAARWMAEHGVPPPARGIRNTGEQAMLVTPQWACGAYVGFVGLA
jgi:catechol 2,3-dioxygenase-like lactoylglutathione lyase family enzyme